MEYNFNLMKQQTFKAYVLWGQTDIFKDANIKNLIAKINQTEAEIC